MRINTGIRLFVATLALLALMMAPVAAAKAPYQVAVVIKATDSDFWQFVLHGADAAVTELGPNVVRLVYRGGPTSEADIDKQVAIVEDIVSKKPDAIVIASTSSEATVPALSRAASMGIKVVLIDNKVHLQDNEYVTFLATNNRAGGALAAQKLLEAIKAKGLPTTGRVGLISSMAGVQVLIDRDEGFQTELARIAPGLKLVPVRYVQNDILEALAAAEDMLTTYPDLVGFFADNNHTGDGVSRAIIERKLQKKVAAVAYDSDPEEVEALKSGALDALIVQDPYRMGYDGVKIAIGALEGKTYEKFIDTGANAITLANLNEPRSQQLLYPLTR
ncbi:MAG: ABC transporter substrate-binding protein [Betaproteobacteria bacterium]